MSMIRLLALGLAIAGTSLISAAAQASESSPATALWRNTPLADPAYDRDAKRYQHERRGDRNVRRNDSGQDANRMRRDKRQDVRGDRRGPQQDIRRDRRDTRQDMRRDRRHPRQDVRRDRRDTRPNIHQDRRDVRRDWRQDRRRNDWVRYNHNQWSDRRYRWGNYYGPRGYRYTRWRYGQWLPAVYWADRYWINNWVAFGLLTPPSGLVWVRYGPDALLIDRYSGEIVQVRYNVFY